MSQTPDTQMIGPTRVSRSIAIMPRRGLLTIGASAAPGELLIRPIEFPAQMRNGLALLALEQGPKAFVRGPGEIVVILVQDEPGLDDMLAAEFVRTQLLGQPLPEGLRAAAQYAGTWREGIIPDRDSVPIEQSLALTYDVIFRNADDSSGRFCWNEFMAGWGRLSAAIWRGAERGSDPSVDSILEKNPDFTRTRSYLQDDRETYRLDVQCAERWLMHFPGVPGESAALILKNPRSSVWRRLAWTDPDSPTGRGYLLVGIEEITEPDCADRDAESPSWRFLTRRARKLSLKSLALELQTAESAAARAASDDPWYDGHRHGHTLIGSPWRGTQLPRERVLDIVRTWTGAVPTVIEPPPVAPHRGWLQSVQMLLVAMVVVATGVLAWNWPPRGTNLNSTEEQGEEAEHNAAPGDGITGSPTSGGNDLPWTAQVDYETEDFSTVSSRLVWERLDEPQTTDTPAVNEVEPPSLSSLRDRRLFILSIGITEYKDSHYKLDGAANDAKVLMDEFAKRSGHCGKGVRTCLIQNEDATSEGIVIGLNWLQGKAASGHFESPTAQDLVLIIVACHAESINSRYFLLPHDFDDSSDARRTLTSLDWQLFKDVFAVLPCKTVVILDTCHAGLADLNRSPTRRKVDFNSMAVDVLLQFDAAPPGVVLLQACNGDETAGGTVYHGRFSKALLNALSRVSPGTVDQREISFLNVADLFQIASEEVRRQSNQQQSPRTDTYPRDLNPKVIPAASSMPEPARVHAGGAPN